MKPLKPKDRVRRALKAIAGIHIFILVVIGAFSIHFAGRARALKGTEEEARQTAQKIESRVQRSTTIESAQNEARLAWKSGENTWETLTGVMTSFSDGLQALLAVPLVTFSLALHALWISREKSPHAPPPEEQQ